MLSYGIVTHGGVGAPTELSDGCKIACESAFRMLEAGKDSLDAAVEAARILEDDGRFNAGKGSALRIDNKTIEMDAAVMDSTGRIGVVINIREVKNPVLIARAVIDTPHLALAGRGAEAFAREQGFEPYREFIRNSSSNTVERPEKLSSDTIGVVALDKKGVFAVATSTGGAVPMMVGRVGDTPMIGCGFYAGPRGAVAVTGSGEESIRKMLAKTAYDMIADNMDAEIACRKGISFLASGVKMGIIVISKKDWAVVARDTMAHWSLMRE